MQRDLESLVRKLNRRGNIHWVEEMRLGKPAYDYLMERVRARTLTRNEMANAFHALFRLRNHGSEQEVFALLRAHTSDDEIRVRTEAVRLLIGMMKLHNLQAPFQPSTCISEIKAALALDLEHDVASLAKDFVAQYGAT